MDIARWLIVTVPLLGACSEPSSPVAQAALECTKDAELSCPRPIFNVHDLKAAEAYYRDNLGFKVDWEHGAPPDFASVSRANAIFFLCEGCQGNPGTWSMVFAKDVDALHEEFQEQGAAIRMPPKDMPWGIRELHVSDRDGNVIRFGTGIE